jgi:hypothetical protein
MLTKDQKSRITRRTPVASGVFKTAAADCERIIAISPFASATKKDILRFLATLPKAMIVLPGNSTNTPSPREIQTVMRRGSVVFAEGGKRKNGRPAFIVTHRAITRMPSQIFAKKPKAADIDDLAAILPQRTILLGDRTVTFFICGELIAFNADGRAKHKRKIDYDILINPAHTIMGHWNHLGKKLKRLSRGSVAVYVTNNSSDHHLTSDVRIYTNGLLLKRNSDINIAWSECSI